MPRPTPAQICWGTLAVVSATAVLLAVSGADSVPAVTVLVVFGLALGTLATALLVPGRAPRDSRDVAPGAVPGAAHGVPGRRIPAAAEREYAEPSPGRR
ncbi:hypothetical protein LO771_22720 [Streptacidiphilus sp. ASG 303]|uniref:hypothetical protein n=1 Tax=Streptacidiphilus sp. ASG 303 TaxID=2896847 RepID=UPI001E2A65FF|nr:hypothetical protein [Streptacidiphilus sp. ASG 303]MCD0485118.1 hypothetical protein [Streptacidiphilus sp. ASG 303]